jgi:hypothetical protein
MLITSNGQLVANGTLAQTKYSLTHHIRFVRILLCKGSSINFCRDCDVTADRY